MRWQLGGNLRPVRMVCEFDWRECPYAVINYVWSEIVADVVDCLTIESMMWKIIAMFFVCTLLVHAIYSKTRWMDETAVNRKNLNIVGCKVQDLELKVNILTYKMQYGTWPLPRQSRRHEIEERLGNVKLTLSNSSDRNTWLKHMLLSPAENAACLPYAKIGPRSVRCLTKLINLETKYMSSRFHRDASPASNKIKSSESSSDKSLKFSGMLKKIPDFGETKEKPKINSESASIIPTNSPTDCGKIDTENCKSEPQVRNYREEPENFSRRQKSCENNSNVAKNFSPSTERSSEPRNCSEKIEIAIETANNLRENRSKTNFNGIAPKKSEFIDVTSVERVNCSQETLQRVTQKLENLHNVLRIHGNANFATHEESTSSKELAESILRDLKMLGNLPIDSESDGKGVESISKTVESCTKNVRGVKEDVDSPGEFENCQTDQNSTSEDSQENSYEIRNEDSNDLTQSDQFHENVETSLKNIKNNYNDPIVIDEDDRDFENFYRNFIPSETSRLDEKNTSPELSDDEEMKIANDETSKEFPDPSLTSSQAELSKETDTDEKSNVDLPREFANLKKSSSTRIENDRERKNIDEIAKSTLNESEDESDDNWPKIKNYFQSKLLEIISEEQSASSSTEKTIKPTEIEFLTQKNQTNEDKSNEIDVKNSVTSKINFVSESSEYFSLSNLEEKMWDQKIVVSPPLINESTSDELNVTNDEILTHPHDDLLQKNISDLVNQSVRNIREYIDLFSKMQNDAIMETKRAISEDNSCVIANKLKNSSSDDSMMHFVNTVAIIDSTSEELPKELPEPALKSLVYLDDEITDDDSMENSQEKTNFHLKRQPGSTSLGDDLFSELREQSSRDFDSRSNFESARSEEDKDPGMTNDSEISSSEPSCKQLVMDYSQENDLGDEKFGETLDLMEFDEETESRPKDSDGRAIESPLTGRTVIGTAHNVVENFDDDTSSHDRACNDKIGNRKRSISSKDENISFDEIHEYVETTNYAILEDTISTKNVESGSVYFTDDQSCDDLTIVRDSTAEIVADSTGNLSETNTWIIEKSETENLIEKGWKNDNDSSFEARDSVMSESLGETTDRTEIKSEKNENFVDRENTFFNAAVDDRDKIGDFNDVVATEKHCTSTDTSGTYMDADSREFFNSSGMSLNLKKDVLTPHDVEIGTKGLSKSARGSSSTPLQQRISWTPPRRGSSLNSTIGKSTKIEKTTKIEHLDIAKINDSRTSTTRSQSSGVNRPRARSTNGQNTAKNSESVNSTTERRKIEKKNVDATQRRSRSYVTPRKNAASPRNSATSQTSDYQSKNKILTDFKNNKIVSEKSSNFGKSSNSKIIEKKLEKRDFTENSNKSARSTNIEGSSKSSIGKTSSKSCIPILRKRMRTKSPMRGPLTMSTGSWRDENFSPSTSEPPENIRAEGNSGKIETTPIVDDSTRNLAIVGKMNDVESSSLKIPDGRTVVYVNIVTERENSATRVIDPKKFLEYLKDRELKIQKVFDQRITESKNDLANSQVGMENEGRGCGETPKILTVVSSAVDEKISRECVRGCSGNSGLTGSWSLRVEQREIEVSAKPSVIDTSTSISDLPELTTETRANIGKFEIFGIPKELTKEEYIELLATINRDPELRQLRDMHKLCDKLGLGFNE